MKRSLVLMTVSLALGIAIFPIRNSTDRTDQTALPPPRKTRPAPDFWNSARVPGPGHDLPIIAIRPEDLGGGASTEPVDHAARIARAISEDDLPAVQSAALSWFEKDPAAARNWLAMQATYDDLQPAISYIASKVAENGDLETALEWTALLPGGTLRDDTIFDIYALALRNGKITAAELDLDGLPPDRQAELLSGAAGD